ncbi:U4/U6.U5 small nuclear ribonucleoprotein 27 kDa protein isoform X1 [Rhineura floridana]|uniref:U4/U6.U5 small nuclear ribonucleoprotein 27 kDa protein isoform X1 n=1 Tax=Rhineura floridana TaxID=261503 RepID=UPI002AC82679|nr:U4/U6.U5 small nuclear ribonucleoprotein 27 kDa protein isoform X1 [Rhineura floridana]
MGRSRSRSPPRRERRRSRSTSRERERRRRERSRSRDRDRRRSRSRSPHRRRSRSPRRHRSSSSSPSRQKDEKKDAKDAKGKERQITEEDLEGKTEEEIEMMKMMGFASFDTTKTIHEPKRWIQQASGFYCLISTLVTCERQLRSRPLILLTTKPVAKRIPTSSHIKWRISIVENL